MIWVIVCILSDAGSIYSQTKRYEWTGVYSKIYGGNGWYIYMGPEVQSDLIDNMYRIHKIVKVDLIVRT